MKNKIIHYCWFGKSPLTPLAEKCISSWKTIMPDYEIKRWDESNFDINCNKWCQNTYKSKNYAHLSDYVRYWAVYNYGGIYLDTDVELLKHLDDLDVNFFAMEKSFKLVAPGLGFRAVKNNKLIESIKNWYEQQDFNPQLKLKLNAPKILTTLLFGSNLKSVDKNIYIEEFTIYTPDYLCPKDWISGEINITENTYAIHHYAESWLN